MNLVNPVNVVNPMNPARLAIALVLLVGASLLAQAPPAPMPSDSEIRDILVDRIDKQHESVGIVVGVIDAKGRRVIPYGSLGKGDTRPLNGDTVFEIGSVTKMFTALLLTDMVQRGEVALADPVAKYLPADVVMPQRGGRQITLQDLATHTSGLPRLPSNLTPKDPSNPYADYSVAQLYQFLSKYQLTRDIDSQFEYSNLGFGLLGHALERRAGRSYDALARARVFGPIGLTNTGIALTADQRARLAVGHNAKLEPVANWDLPTLAGAGALRSTANDMLAFLAAALGYAQTPLAPAMAALLTVRRPTTSPGMGTALGWQTLGPAATEIIWKDGGTGGYASFLGYDPRSRVGVVVLSNAFAASGALTGVDDIGLHLLNPQIPLNRPRQPHTAVTVDPRILDGYAGRYQLAPNFIITITREGNRTFAQATGQMRFEIFPESEREFFAQIGDIQIAFEADSQGRGTSLLLKQNGTVAPAAKRIE